MSEEVVVLDLSDDENEQSIPLPESNGPLQVDEDINPISDVDFAKDGEYVKEETKPVHEDELDEDKIKEQQEKAKREQRMKEEAKIRSSVIKQKSQEKLIGYKEEWTSVENQAIEPEEEDDEDDDEDILSDTPKKKSTKRKRVTKTSKIKSKSKPASKAAPKNQKPTRASTRNSQASSFPSNGSQAKPQDEATRAKKAEILDDSDDDKFVVEVDIHSLKDAKSKALMDKLAALSRSKESLLQAQHTVPVIEFSDNTVATSSDAKESIPVEGPAVGDQEENDDGKIQLMVLDGTRNWSKKFIVYKTTEFKEIMSAALQYYQKKHYPVKHVDLYFDDSKLEPTQTPGEMGMTSDDQIDAVYSE